jgi:predicted signal transduction protein with EAL and GGDEF domain
VVAACAVDLGDELLHLSASVGFTLVDEHVDSAEHALMKADRAMRETRPARTDAAG